MKIDNNYLEHNLAISNEKKVTQINHNDESEKIAKELFAIYLETSFKEAFNFKPTADSIFSGGKGEEMARNLLHTEYMKNSVADSSFKQIIDRLVKEVSKLKNGYENGSQ